MMPHVDVAELNPSALRRHIDPIFDLKGVCVVDLRNWNAEQAAAHWKLGYRAVSVLLDEDRVAVEINRKLLMGGRLTELRSHGWKVLGWAPAYDDGEAIAAAALSKPLDGWWTNLEAWAEGDKSALTSAWLLTFRRAAPDKPLGVSCLSSTTGNFARSFDYEACLAAGAAIGPQVYGSNIASYTVEAMRSSLARAGVPDEVVRPWFSIDGGPVPWGDYKSWPHAHTVWTAENFHGAGRVPA